MPGGTKEPYKAELKPGKLVVCKNCGCVGPDFNACVRCKKKIAEGAKVVDDPSAASKNKAGKVSDHLHIQKSTGFKRNDMVYTTTKYI
jgi:hypothetical protein